MNKKNAAYAHLAKWFEYLNDDCGYEGWFSYLMGKLSPYSLREGLDVGCGGGWFTRAFQRNGFMMTGMDASAEMLDFAQETALKQGVRSTYVLGDITKMKLPARFDFVTAINDCFNYIPKNKLLSAFKNVRSSLKKGGIFLFDISSLRKFNEKIANTVFADDRDDVTYLSFNKKEVDGVTMEVTLFIKEEDGRFQRLDETHRQYAYSEEEICEALETAGFAVLEVEGHLGEEKAVSDRITFLAKKR